MLQEIPTINFTGKTFRQIITAGGPYSYALTDTTLFRVGLPDKNCSWELINQVFPRNGVRCGDDTYFAFAKPDLGPHALLYFPYTGAEQNFNLANEDTVTCIYHPPFTKLVIVGLKCGLKVFRFNHNFNGFVHVRSHTLSFNPIEIHSAVPKIPTSCPTLFVKSSDGYYHTLNFSPENNLGFSRDNQLTLASRKTDQGDFSIRSSKDTGTITWRNKSTNGQEASQTIHEEIRQAEISHNPNFKHLGVLLLRSGKVVIVNVLKNPSEWITLDGHNFNAMALSDQMKTAPKILLAAGPQLFQYELTP